MHPAPGLIHRHPSARRRAALADDLAVVLTRARRPARAGGISARVPIQHAQVLAARYEVEALAARLRALDRNVRAEDLRAVHQLLCDPSGPLFQPSEPGTLRRRVRSILDAMA